MSMGSNKTKAIILRWAFASPGERDGGRPMNLFVSRHWAMVEARRTAQLLRMSWPTLRRKGWQVRLFAIRVVAHSKKRGGSWTAIGGTL